MKFLATLFALNLCALASQALAQEAQAGGEPASEDIQQRFELTFAIDPNDPWSPIDLSRGTPLVPVVISGEATCAAIDPTLAVSVIDADIARAAGLELAKTDNVVSMIEGGELPINLALGADISVTGQFELKGTIPAIDLPDVDCLSGEKIGMVIGGKLVGSLAFIIDPRRSQIVFVPSGKVNITAERSARLDWRDGIIIGTINQVPVQLEVALGSIEPVSVYEGAFERIFPGREPEPLSGSVKPGSQGEPKLGIPSAEIEFGPLSVSEAVLLMPGDSKRADARVSYAAFRQFSTVFDKGAGTITILLPNDESDTVAEREGRDE
jgi:hypothetical protein